MVRQHHNLNGYETEQTPGNSGGQRSLVCYSSWGHKRVEQDLVTKQQHNIETKYEFSSQSFKNQLTRDYANILKIGRVFSSVCRFYYPILIINTSHIWLTLNIGSQKLLLFLLEYLLLSQVEDLFTIHLTEKGSS